MSVKSCLPLFLALLLAQSATMAAAESPLPDPIAPAVIGRPLEQIGPVRKAPTRPEATRPEASRPEASRPEASRTEASRPEASRPEAARQAKAKPAAGAQAPARRSASAAPRVPPQQVLGGVPPGPAPGALEGAPASQRLAKKAVDDRADPRMRLDDVGKGIHFARKPLGPGVYFDSKDRAYVRRYYEQQPAPAEAANWQIGQPVPRGATLNAIPKTLVALLPKLPPGHRYVQVGGEVLLIADSGMVVDGISRSPR